MEKSRSENHEEFLNLKREKSEIKSKINLIYDSKMKYNVIGRKIRMKTRILTWDSARNDPIDRQIKGFSFFDFKDKIWHSRGTFFLFFRWNLDFKNSLDAEMSIEEKVIKRFKD